MSGWTQYCDHCEMAVRGKDREECAALRKSHEAACAKEREQARVETDRQAYLQRTGRKDMTP